jgi:hypothetical protein
MLAVEEFLVGAVCVRADPAIPRSTARLIDSDGNLLLEVNGLS